MADTLFTEPAHWRWLIVFYFFIGGIAGGAVFLAALLHFFGSPADRPLVRVGYYVGLVGAIISGILLILDLSVPTRFWHMLLASETGAPIIKLYSPISFGAWGLALFGLFSFLGALGAAAEEGRVRWAPARSLAAGTPAGLIAIGGAISGLFLAGYTGVLLTVTNRPIWADSTWIGFLFVISATSTAAAALILLALNRRLARPAALDWLHRFDKVALVLELVALVLFITSLGAMAQIFLNLWGVLLGLGVVIVGILIPLGMGTLARARERLATSAALVLLGGFLLRVVVILTSEQVHVLGGRVVLP